MRLISGADLKAKLDGLEKPKLVFALGDWQYSSLHIPGSIPIPCTPQPDRPTEPVSGLDRDEEIVVYCSSQFCPASVSAYYYLKQQGFTNVCRYAGGLLDWWEAGYPTEGDMAVAYAGKRPAPSGLAGHESV